MQTKLELRKQLSAQRSLLPEIDWQTRSRTICEKLVQLDTWPLFKNVALYRSFRQEVDLHVLLQLSPEKTYFFPVIHPQSGTMDFHAYAGEESFQQNSWGLSQPGRVGAILRPDAETLIVIPALAFDQAGHRLGYGKGYYDRYLESHKASTLGVCFHEFLLAKLPSEAHDQVVDAVLTETQFHQVR